ncbi:MAG: hypothetical protein AB7U92_08690, partial [Piscinibacter sp.]|uniref:hypothetical protein n=1 Tax=Piscinibacter sp. TaxID=1903157 RepID=UPI003D0CB698
WRTVEEGVTATEWFPRIGAQLCAALWDGDRALAETIALRSSAWMQQAASTLPPAWRENFLLRAPLLQALPLRPLAAVRLRKG